MDGSATTSSLTGGDEYFTLNLSTPSSGSTISTDAGSACVYILANEHTPVAYDQTFSLQQGQSLAAAANFGQLWQSRRPPSWAEREAFGAAVRQGEELFRTQQGIAADAALDHYEQAALSIVGSYSRYSWNAAYSPSRGGDFLKPFTVKKWQPFAEGHNTVKVGISGRDVAEEALGLCDHLGREREPRNWGRVFPCRD